MFSQTNEEQAKVKPIASATLKTKLISYLVSLVNLICWLKQNHEYQCEKQLKPKVKKPCDCLIQQSYENASALQPLCKPFFPALKLVSSISNRYVEEFEKRIPREEMLMLQVRGPKLNLKSTNSIKL